MARFNRGKGKNEEKIFFTDSLTEADKKRINTEFSKGPVEISNLIEELLKNELSIKILWSDYSDSYTAIVSPITRDHPSNGTFYSVFHENWQKALFTVYFLLKDRYDFGDWAKDRAKLADNSW